MKTKEQLLASIEAIRTQLATVSSDVSEVFAAIPVVVEPPPPPPARPNLYVEGDKLFRKDGVELPEFASIEFMIGGGTTPTRVKQIISTCVALGATAVGPLMQGNPTATFVRTLLQATREAGLICLLNADHCGGSSYLVRQEIANVVNEFDHVILQAEVELGSGMSDEAWRDQAVNFVRKMAAAYPAKPLRVGLPDGGRNIGPALKYAKAVVDATQHKGGLLFAPQMYWSTRGGWYQGLGGFVAGFDGTMQALRRIAAQDGVYMFSGTDETDDVGLTNQSTILDEADKQGTSVQVWALTGDGIGNNLVGDAGNVATITSVGRAVQAQLKDYPRIVL
jgi:hypothetical protein